MGGKSAKALQEIGERKTENECKSFIRKFLKLFFSERRNKFQGYLFCNSLSHPPFFNSAKCCQNQWLLPSPKSINDIHFPRQNFQVFLMLIISHCFSAKRKERFFAFFPHLYVTQLSSPLSTLACQKISGDNQR
jgi:hypothetical protein